MAYHPENGGWEEELRHGDALVDAASDGDIEAMKAAIKAGAKADFDRSRALRRAASNGHDAAVEFLLERGADIHAMSDEALRFAASNGQTTTVITLLDGGADPNAMEGEPLIKAATRGDPTMVRALLDAGADPHFSDDQALRRAAFGGHTFVVGILMAHHADPFAMFGSALELARTDDHIGVIERLSEEMNAQRSLFLQELDGLSSTRGFLRAPYLETGEPGFIRAVKMNCLSAVVEKMKATGDGFCFDDLHGMKDREGRSFATLAAERGQLQKIFDLDLWREKFPEMQAAWDKLPPRVQEKSGMSPETLAGMTAELHQRRLREKAGRFSLKPRGK